MTSVIPPKGGIYKIYLERGRLSMVFVTKKKGESKDQVFKKFTKMFISEDIVDQVRKKQFYKKPSLQRKEKEKERLQKRYQRRSY